MSGVLTIFAPVKKGSPLLSGWQRERLNKFFAQHEGKYICLSALEQGKKRTSRQNRYYWGAFVERVAQWQGMDPEEAHEALKMKFLGRNFLTLGDEEFIVPKSSKVLSTDQFGDYLMRIQAWAAENGFIIETPEEYFARESALHNEDE